MLRKAVRGSFLPHLPGNHIKHICLALSSIVTFTIIGFADIICIPHEKRPSVKVRTLETG